jgi:drug/metabolite transporter (DMT)-like permease
MDPNIWRFALAGAVIVAGGVLIATTEAGVREGAAWKGAVIAVVGLLFLASALRKVLGKPRGAKGPPAGPGRGGDPGA